MNIRTKVIKKDLNVVEFDSSKIIDAVKKSAERIMVQIADNDIDEILNNVATLLTDIDKIDVATLHNIVEVALDKTNKNISTSYRDYRNYKKEFVGMIDEVYKKAQSIRYLGDKENSNTDSALVSTKRSLVYNELNKEFYNKFFLTGEERLACKQGYIYIHDKSARRDTMNCCLFDTKTVMTGGFEMGNMWYNEPKSIDTACDVLGDIIMNSASQQYGGWSTRIDDLLAPYAKKSYDKYKNEIKKDMAFCSKGLYKLDNNKIHKLALKKVRRDLEQGVQGLEYKLNSVASSRGDYPFVTFAVGLDDSLFGRMVTEAVLKVRKEGQGKEEFKKQVLFPKIIFLYDEEKHGEGKALEYLFNLGIECSGKAMYPDWLSLSGEGYVPSVYKQYGEIVYPMGCRAFLSKWFLEGGMYPAHEKDKPVFTGRFNVGAVTLHLPMIYKKALDENKSFFDVLDYYLEMARGVHIRTYEYLGEMRASTNPLAYCEGGFYGGHLKPSDKIKPLLKSATASFGITALNELQQLHNQKSLVQDNQFSLTVMEYINRKVEKFKEEDKHMYAIYGTPAENLCGLQVKQFKNMYGVVENVSDRAYTTNSFHCHVTEEINPIEKQDRESEFWDLFNGGKIQYVKYPIPYNFDAMKTLVRRAMSLGFYEGINLALSYCDDCGHQEVNMEICPKCNSGNLTKIDRMNGYLSYSRVKGDTRLNEAKMEEIKERVSM